MINSDKKSIIFFTVLLILFIYSIFNLYNKYIVNQDFVYFLSEEEIPNQSDLKEYPE